MTDAEDAKIEKMLTIIEEHSTSRPADDFLKEEDARRGIRTKVHVSV